MNALTQRTTQLGKPFFLRVSRSLIGLTISKALKISRDNKEAINFLDP